MKPVADACMEPEVRLHGAGGAALHRGQPRIRADPLGGHPEDEQGRLEANQGTPPLEALSSAAVPAGRQRHNIIGTQLPICFVALMSKLSTSGFLKMSDCASSCWHHALPNSGLAVSHPSCIVPSASHDPTATCSMECNRELLTVWA